VLVIRFAIYHGLKKWKLLAVVAKRLTEWNPKEPGNLLNLLMHPGAQNQFTPHTRLTRAASLHPTGATIQFNLACYEAQLGNLDRAKAQLK